MTSIIAHRGASAYRPENTMAAFELAIVQGADMFELDVQRSADGVIVAFHDFDTARWNGRKELVTALTWSELQQLNIGGERIPTLVEVCQLARAHQVRLNVELKGYGLAADVARVLHDEQMETQTLISCFQPNELIAMHQVAPRLPLGYLMGTRTFRPDVRLRESWPFRALRSIGATAWHPTYLIPMVLRVIPRVRHAGYQVNVWTVNDAAMMRRLIALEVDGIITDRPDLLRQVLHDTPRHLPRRRIRWRQRA
jgi:glycerophosphoryl diester phosphodiesterase